MPDKLDDVLEKPEIKAVQSEVFVAASKPRGARKRRAPRVEGRGPDMAPCTPVVDEVTKRKKGREGTKIGAWFLPDEVAILDRRCAESGLVYSDYIRKMTLEETPSQSWQENANVLQALVKMNGLLSAFIPEVRQLVAVCHKDSADFASTILLPKYDCISRTLLILLESIPMKKKRGPHVGTHFSRSVQSGALSEEKRGPT